MTGAAHSQPSQEPLRRCKHDVSEDCPACAEETIAGLKARAKELTKALEKLRSYNVDIHAGRINYRPFDHIQVIDAALQPGTPAVSR